MAQAVLIVEHRHTNATEYLILCLGYCQHVIINSTSKKLGSRVVFSTWRSNQAHCTQLYYMTLHRSVLQTNTNYYEYVTTSSSLRGLSLNGHCRFHEWRPCLLISCLMTGSCQTNVEWSNIRFRTEITCHLELIWKKNSEGSTNETSGRQGEVLPCPVIRQSHCHCWMPSSPTGCIFCVYQELSAHKSLDPATTSSVYLLNSGTAIWRNYSSDDRHNWPLFR